MTIPVTNNKASQNTRHVQEKKITEMERIKILLDYLGLVSEYVPISAENKFEQLYIAFLNGEQKPNGMVLSISFINDFDGTDELDPEGKTHRLQFFSLVGEIKADQSNKS